MQRARNVVFVFVALAIAFAPSVAAAGETLRVLVPERQNLQFMSFWIAKGAGYFADEGIDVELLAPSAPSQTAAYFEEQKPDVAVLPPPVYLKLIAARAPVVLVANLLANDPINLLVRPSVLAERNLSASQPLRDRLGGLGGIRLGVAPHPPTRLRMLFASQGLDVDKTVELVILHGKEQNAAFHEGRVDALYAHTPYLERAILEDGAVVLVNQSRGEVAELANRRIHALAASRSFVEQRRDRVVSAVRAIARAEALIHRSHEEAVSALAREFPGRSRRELETIVNLYEPAIPPTPELDLAGVAAAAMFFPAGMPVPDLTGVDLARHVDVDVAIEATRPSSVGRRWAIVGIVVGALIIAFIVAVRAKRRLS